jgi:Rad3-related DNA helicase
MTSATLAVGGTFEYFLHRVGLDAFEEDRVVNKTFGSPFDYNEQALLLVPTFLSSPKHREFSEDIARLLLKVITSHVRGTMVLFTSYRMLEDVYRQILPALDESGIRLLGQGLSGSRSALLKQFLEDERSVLLGTNSFWEGIDVPGSALETLVITKIPFDVPTEPLIEARMEQVQKESGNGFMNYAVPEAIVRFRQGFGRLIRSGGDRGVVLMLDNRIVQTSYGTVFLESLPVPAMLCTEEKELMETLNLWFQ